MNIIKRIWKDPVGSNVIAGLILIILTSFATIFIPAVRNVFLALFSLSIKYPFVLSTIVLAIVVIFLFFRLRKKTNNSDHPNDTPSNWISSLTIEQLVPFRFLFWFPLHHTLKTSKYYSSSETLGHIPEIRDLLEHGVIKNVCESVIFYSIEIDKDCYKFMDELFQSLPEEEKGKQLFETLKEIDFIMLFQKQSY